jgi:Spy/CpxP family protein refolding chaperone
MLTSGLALAQRPDGPPPPGPQGPGQERGQGRGRGGGPGGRWWDNPEMAKQLNLSTEQRRKMDDIFQQQRVKLIDLHAAVAREEATLDPLMQAAQPDDSKILPQIDRIAQARAELEKADARLQLALRHVLTPEQWETLQSEQPHRPPPPGRQQE